MTTGARYRDLAAKVGDGPDLPGPLAVPPQPGPYSEHSWAWHRWGYEPRGVPTPSEVCPPQPVTEAPFTVRAWLYHQHALCLPSGCRPGGCLWWPGWECEVGDG